jgi:hypothetical protein
MTPDNGILGRCPSCVARTTRAWLLIGYENTKDQTGVWAEYPDCEDILEPG